MLQKKHYTGLTDAQVLESRAKLDVNNFTKKSENENKTIYFIG